MTLQHHLEFARQHHRRFSAVFWLGGRSEDTLKPSVASCASRIPHGQIVETSRTYAADSGADVDVVVKDVMAWLARPVNTVWLLIFDNVDRDYKAQGGDPDAYDVRSYLRSYLSGADHGSVLVTSRLARLEQLGDSHGLPLAIAQAGAYLQESGVGLTTYLRFYKQQ
jgi:hypothetical protein